MPHFMDVHSDMHELTLADIEQAHLRDVEAQDRHGVTYVQFFHSADTGQVFCLAEGPSAEACEAVHFEANGIKAETIIPVEPAMFEGFMGGGSVTELGVTLDSDGELDTGWRAIFFTDIVGSTRITEELGDRAGMALVQAHDRLAGAALERHGGRKVNHTGDGMMASFSSLPSAVLCALELQQDLAEYRAETEALPLEVRIGIHAGEPVAERGDLFGLAVNIASRVCDAAEAGEILISDVVLEALDASTVLCEPRGERVFNGLSVAVAVHAVHQH